MRITFASKPRNGLSIDKGTSARDDTPIDVRSMTPISDKCNILSIIELRYR